MGLFNAMTGYAHKSELRESKDEIICGALVAGLSARGWRCFRVVGDSGRQVVGFRVPGDPVVSAAYITVDRKTGSGALTSGLGSKTVIGFLVEMRHKVSDPDDLAIMWQTDVANLFKMPVAGEVRVNHQLSSVTARTYAMVDLDQYVQGSQVNAGPLVEWAVAQVKMLRDRLEPLAK